MNFYDEYTKLGLKQELSDDFGERVRYHKMMYRNMRINRYKELLPSLIKYTQDTPDDKPLIMNVPNEIGYILSVDFHKVEIALRNGYHVVIGADNKRHIRLLGYINSNLANQPFYMIESKPITKNDISFIIPKDEQLNVYSEINYSDGGYSGNFVVLRNKLMNLNSEDEVLEVYGDILSEIEASRYSAIIQSKISTVFSGQVGDQDVNNIVADLMNGNPIIKTTSKYDAEDLIYEVQGAGATSAILDNLKRENSNYESDLQNMLGINSLAVDKASGTSNGEANSNTPFTTANANMFLDGRKPSIDMLNKRYGFNIRVAYDDRVASEMTKLESYSEGGENLE